jgi:hypothetical protein
MNYGLLIIGCLVAILGHAVAWFGSNSQFMWESWKNNPIYSVILLGIPSNIIFWLAAKTIYSSTHSIWQIRWIMFAASFPPMLMLSHYYFNESFLNTKNIITLILALSIIFVQFYFRGK